MRDNIKVDLVDETNRSAIKRLNLPEEIISSDRGSQCSSEAITNLLKKLEI